METAVTQLNSIHSNKDIKIKKENVKVEFLSIKNFESPSNVVSHSPKRFNNKTWKAFMIFERNCELFFSLTKFSTNETRMKREYMKLVRKFHSRQNGKL